MDFSKRALGKLILAMCVVVSPFCIESSQAQTPTYSVKSVSTQTYTGYTTLLGGPTNAGGTIKVQSSANPGAYRDGNIAGGAFSADLYMSVNPKARTWNVVMDIIVVVKCIGATPSSVTYSLGSLGTEYQQGSLASYGNSPTVHGSVIKLAGVAAPPANGQSLGPVFGPATTSFSRDADGDWVTQIHVSNNTSLGSVTGSGGWAGGSCLVFVKTVDGQTLGNVTNSYPFLNYLTSNGQVLFP